MVVVVVVVVVDDDGVGNLVYGRGYPGFEAFLG